MKTKYPIYTEKVDRGRKSSFTKAVNREIYHMTMRNNGLFSSGDIEEILQEAIIDSSMMIYINDMTEEEDGLLSELRFRVIELVEDKIGGSMFSLSSNLEVSDVIRIQGVETNKL